MISPPRSAAAPLVRAEPKLRRAFNELRTNAPDYSKMTARMASVMKQQLGTVNATLRALPAISTLTFRSIAPNGADIFHMVNGDKVTESRIVAHR